MSVRKLTTLLAFVVGGGLIGPSAYAAQDLDYSSGTPAGTEIANNVTLDYQVDSVMQDQIDTASDTDDDNTGSLFVVDRILDVDVTRVDAAEIEVAPGANGGDAGTSDETDGAFLTYTVTNQSNDEIDLFLSTSSANGSANPFVAAISSTITTPVTSGDESTLVAMCVDDDGTGGTPDGSCDGGDLTIVSGDIFRLPNAPPGQTFTILAFFDIDTSAANGGLYDAHALVAAVTNNNTTDAAGVIVQADSNGNVQNGGAGGANVADDGDTGDTDVAVNAPQDVFGDDTGTLGYDFVGGSSSTTPDGDSDGQHSDTSVFVIRAAELEITKESRVVFDPINGVGFTGSTVTEGGTPSAPTQYYSFTSTAITDAGGAINPKAIPGAVVEYTITVTNGDGAAPTAETATDISVGDSAPTNTTAGNDENNSTLDAATFGITDIETLLDTYTVTDCDGLVTVETFDSGAATFSAAIGECEDNESATIVFYVTID